MRLLKRFVYIFYITFFLLILSTTIIFTNAFSISWVYEDLLAHPQYKVVVLENQLIPNSRIENHVIEKVQADSNNVQEMIQIDQSSSSGESSEKSKPTSIIMRTSTGQPYVCSIPYIDNQTTIEENKNNSDDNNKNNKPEENKDDDINLMKKGLELLEPLKKNCLYYINGWWTYEYCHMRHVRQFHQIIQAGGNQVVEDESSESFFLGKYDPRHATLPSPSDNDDDNNNFGEKKRTLGTDLQVGGGKKYLVQRWSDGTKCDLTGNPRRVEIQFHCNLQSRDYIAVITEMYTCHYLVIVHTSLLCTDPAFHNTSFSKINPIECIPVVSDAYYQHVMEKRLESGLKGKSSKQHTNEKGEKFDSSNNQNQQQQVNQALNKNNPESTDNNNDNDNDKKDIEMARNKIKMEKLAAIANKLLENTNKQQQDDDHGGIRKIKILLLNNNGNLEQIGTIGNGGRSNSENLKEGDDGKKESSDFDLENLLNNLGIFNTKHEKVLFEEQNNQKGHQAKLSKIYETRFDSDVVDDTRIDADNEEKK
ncbi:17424_t:CDS:2 [Entrophospora sp. SA101]|nr:17424_t:CDS:2 [Entrophospora sp. SA101]